MVSSLLRSSLADGIRSYPILIPERVYDWIIFQWVWNRDGRKNLKKFSNTKGNWCKIYWRIHKSVAILDRDC